MQQPSTKTGGTQPNNNKKFSYSYLYIHRKFCEMHGSRRRSCLSCLMVSIVFCGLFVICFALGDRTHVETVIESTAHIYPLVGQYLSLNGIEAVYQLPTPLENIDGVLFVAHGCSHAATDWWPKSTSCTKCTGLPIEMSIAREAIYNQKFAVLAISSLNRVHKCWNAKDIPRVQEMISYFYSNIIPGKNVTLHALGASSGGSFVGFLSQQKQDISISSACVQISSVGGGKLASMPPTIFVLMSRDEHTVNHVKAVTSEIPKSKVLVTSPKEVGPDYFFLRSNKMISLEESKLIHKALYEDGIIDSKHFLIDDPRTTEWREVFLFQI